MKLNQIGATLTEFVAIGPIIFLLGMTGLQYTLMYNAKTNLTYASYEAARAGAIANASPEEIELGLFKGFLPYLSATKGNTGSAQDISKLLLETRVQEAPFTRIQIINPTPEAFNDFNNVTLQKVLGTTQKVIPNKLTDMENLKSYNAKGQSSGLSISEANVLKLRITYGYEPKIPLIGNVVAGISNFLSGSKDAYQTMLFAAGRIPIVVDVSSQMLSPAVQNSLKVAASQSGDANGQGGIGHHLPDLSNIRLPKEYEGMSREEILQDIMENGDSKRDDNMSHSDWLKLLAAVGLIGYGSSQLDSLAEIFDHSNDGTINSELISDFMEQGNSCPMDTNSVEVQDNEGNQDY